MEEDFGFQLNIQSSCSPSPIHCSTCAFMYNFTPTDVGVFLVTMCKINYLLYFAKADVVALTKDASIVK